MGVQLSLWSEVAIPCVERSAINENAVAEPLAFYIGAHRPHWLALSDRSLFVSDVTLRNRRTLPRARSAWALDSGGFSELSIHGCWSDTAAEYAARVARYQSEIGQLEWASVRDWMCEPFVTHRTGLSVEMHQERTIDSYLELRDLAPSIQWLPVLQGWCLADYWRHLEQYERRGIDLRSVPLVGVGSVCRRQSKIGAGHIFSSLAAEGLRLHGFGVKLEGLRSSACYLRSADSMAWSYSARRQGRDQNALGEALSWADENIDPILDSQRVGCGP